MPRDLLLEIGTEELPASFLAGALDALPGIATELFSSLRLTHGQMRAVGTPRRIALLVSDVAEKQPDLSVEVLGPPRSAALDANGKPTRAGEGFARKHGLAADALTVVATDKGEYVAVRREEKGRAALEVLPGAIESLWRRVPFAKSMRWGTTDIAFGRPIHWLVALYGDELVPASFADIPAARTTRGHRFLAPDEITLDAPAPYVETLRKAHVVVDVNERRSLVQRALEDSARKTGGSLIEDPGLLEECISLVEEPHVLTGSFDEVFLALPTPVIVTVMRTHQRYFAVRSAKNESLLPRYLNVVNTALDPAGITRGNDRVLRARLKDARFFIEEDRKIRLDSRVEKLDGIVFQAKLGTVGEKTRRVAKVQQWLSRTSSQSEQDRGTLAARLCKVDLTTLIVGEFPELQGEMGRFYALQEGVHQEVADAIREHYLPRGAGDAIPPSRLSASLAVADRIDTLVGCFGVGLVPSGSADPFALRRAALGIVRIALEGEIDVRVRDTITFAYAQYEGKAKLAPQEEIVTKLDEFFRARLRAYYGEKHKGDLIEACLAAWDGGSMRDFDARIRALSAFRLLPEYESLTVAFKRTYNIARDVTNGTVDRSLLVEPAEQALAERFGALQPSIEKSVGNGAYDEALTLIARELREPIDRFFENVFVMVDDTRVRDNRLKLLGEIARSLTKIAHFHLLST